MTPGAPQQALLRPFNDLLCGQAMPPVFRACYNQPAAGTVLLPT